MRGCLLRRNVRMQLLVERSQDSKRTGRGQAPPHLVDDDVTVNELAPNYPKVQQGLPPAPSTDFATVSNNPVGSFLSVPPYYKNAYAQQFNFGVEHELRATNIVLKAFYLGNLGRRLDIN